MTALVSSGAVGAGMGRLGLDRRPTDLAKLQAVAAVGQAYLIEAYDRTFRRHGHHAAQVLLTTDDLQLDLGNCLLGLLGHSYNSSVPAWSGGPLLRSRTVAPTKRKPSPDELEEGEDEGAISQAQAPAGKPGDAAAQERQAEQNNG